MNELKRKPAYLFGLLASCAVLLAAISFLFSGRRVNVQVYTLSQIMTSTPSASAIPGTPLPATNTPTGAPPPPPAPFFALLPGVYSSAAGDIAGALRARLELIGVPVKAVYLVSSSPANVEVVVQLQGSPGLTMDDEWHIILAAREAALAYLTIGKRLNTYTVHMIDLGGHDAGSIHGIHNPNSRSQQNAQGAPPLMEGFEIQQQLTQKLAAEGLNLLSLDVQTGKVTRRDTRLVDIQYEVVSGENLNGLLNNLKPALDELNSQGANIALVRMRFFDPQGKPSLQVINDIETGDVNYQSWTENTLQVAAPPGTPSPP